MTTTTTSSVLAEVAEQAARLLARVPGAEYVSVHRNDPVLDGPLVSIRVTDPDTVCRLAEVDPHDEDAVLVLSSGHAWSGEVGSVALVVHAHRPYGDAQHGFRPDPPDVVPGEVV